MLDFRNENLYDSRRKDMEEFLNLVLVTKEERNRKIEEDDDDIEDSLEDMSDDEIDKFFKENMDDEGNFKTSLLNEELDETKKEEVEEDTIFKPISELGTPYETDNYWKDLIISPYYLFYYMIRSLSVRIKDRTNWDKFLGSLWKVSCVTFLVSLLMLIFVGEVKFLFSMGIQTVVSGLMFVVSLVLVKLISIDGILDSFRKMEPNEKVDDVEKELEGFINIEDENEEVSEDDVLEDELTEEDFVNEDDYDIEDDLEEEMEYVEEKAKSIFGFDNMMPEVSKRTEPLIPYSPVDVNVDIDTYLNQLKEIYHKNSKYEGVYINKRADLVKSFSDYLISNDKRFGSWEVVSDYSTEYNNLLYTFYLALVKIDNRMKNKEDEDNKIYVNLLEQNPLMYKLEVELPEYINVEKLNRNKSKIEDSLKESDSDTEVSVLLSAYRQGIVIKFFKPAKGLVSLGDILRYENENTNEPQAYEHFLSEKMGLPLLLGLRGNEHPTVIDLADNTSGVIAGESGSGKSWGTFLILLNLIISNSYNDLNFIIMDKKKAVFWRELARLPHTLGYHTEVQDYFDVLQEIKEEMDYRKELLQKINKESWAGLRKSLRESGNYEDLQAFPWLVVIIDEMTNTMVEVRDMAGEKNKHIIEKFEGDLKQIIQEGRSLGIKLISIGQRTIAESIPKSVMVNSKFKLFFSLALSDYNKGINENDLKNVSYPKQKGQALMVDEQYTSPVLLRTLTLGGVNDDQITNLIRILAFEWNRRSKGKDLTMPNRLKFTYNRDKIREQVFEDMEKGKLFLGGKDSNDDLSNIANLIRNRQDITSEDELPAINNFVIEKEDRNGNVIDDFGIDDDDDDDSSEEKVNHTPVVTEQVKESNERHIKITTNQRSTNSTGHRKAIINQNLRRKTDNTSKEDRIQKMRQLREKMKDNSNTEEVDVKESSINKPKLNTTRDRREGLSVEQYIRKYGIGEFSTKKMIKSDVEEVFSKQEIKRALDNIRIAESGNYYVI